MKVLRRPLNKVDHICATITSVSRENDKANLQRNQTNMNEKKNFKPNWQGVTNGLDVVGRKTKPAFNSHLHQPADIHGAFLWDPCAFVGRTL